MNQAYSSCGVPEEKKVSWDPLPASAEMGAAERALADAASGLTACRDHQRGRHPKAGKDPLAAGLEAITVGYGLRFPDDNTNLERQFEVYDALYAWCCLETARES